MKKEQPHEEKKDSEKELKDTLQRLQAEFENYRKRVERERLEFRDCCKADFMKKLLPILDSFELGLKNCSDPANFKKGMEVLYAQLYSLLESEGLKRVDALNKDFDPYFHEALMQVDGESDGKIAEVFLDGYTINGRLLRPARVKITRKHDPGVSPHGEPQL